MHMLVQQSERAAPETAGQGGESPLISVRSLRKSFGENEVLKGISAEVSKGEVISIIGPSGSGKSTFLRCINFLEVPTSGEILFSGEKMDYAAQGIGDRLRLQKRLAEYRTHVGMVFQSYNLWLHKTVLENIIEAPVQVKKEPREQSVETAMTLLRRFGLEEKKDEYPGRLSGGQQQRVAIIRALAMSPRVMLFDEVTSALDPELVGEVLEVLRILAESGMTMLLVTHEMAFARDCSSRVLFFDNGVIEEEGPAREVLTNPQKERTQKFLSRSRR